MADLPEGRDRSRRTTPAVVMVPLLFMLVLATAAASALTGPSPAGAATSSATWTQLTPATSPPVAGGSMAYDGATGAMVVFGGGQTWSWDGTDWTQLHPITSPPARVQATMSYDAATGTVVLFGGLTNGALGTTQSDTWSWDGTDWTQLHPITSPPARWQAAMDYDPATGTVVLFGGRSNNSVFTSLADTWSWDGTNWTQLHPAASPTASYQANMAYDPATGAMVLVSGQEVFSFETSPGVYSPIVYDINDTWSWDGANWTPAPNNPVVDANTGSVTGGVGLGGVAVANMAFDPALDALVFHAEGQGCISPGCLLSQDYTWDGTTWTQIHPAAEPPVGATGPMAYDASTGTIVLLNPVSDLMGGYTAGTSSFGGPPVVTAISPASGPAGSTVVVNGANLLGTTAVTFGTTPAAIVADTASSVTVTVPAGTGVVDVLVTTAGGTSTATAADDFPYQLASTITSADSTTFTENVAGAFTPAATGSPTSTITESGALPSGVTFDGTTLSGTPAAGSAGTYPVTFTATNGVGSPATQSFTLTVDGFGVTTAALPDATPGALYGPVTLQAAGAGVSASPYVTTVKWKKVSLPKGLRLSNTGVLSGKPNAKLPPGSYSVSVQVTEKVTTLNGKKRVKTVTVVQATIPLYIS